MAKFKVVCNKKDYAYSFDNLKQAKKAAQRHNKRTKHFPIFVFEINNNSRSTRTELLKKNEGGSLNAVYKEEAE